MLSRKDFEVKWKQLANESHTPEAIDAAWKRYQHVFCGPPDAPFATPLQDAPTYRDPDAADLRSVFDQALASSELIDRWQIIDVPGNKRPWISTGYHLQQGQYVTTLATGRLWRNQLLDLWLGPQFGLWFKVGVDGRVFNGKAATNTFTAPEDGELYVGTQFPGQFGNPHGGRLQGPLNAYDNVKGGFSVVMIVWKAGVSESTIQDNLSVVASGVDNDKSHLIDSEASRLTKLKADKQSIPQEWSFLWFLGQSDHFTQHTEKNNNVSSICCRPHGKAGILQKSLAPPVPLTGSTVLSWDWLIAALPSRLREDLTISHDYLSIAVEFENGRDLTYTWSWELPVGFGYWCPLATWSDREYHIVLRSGTQELGKWLAEKRNIYQDYDKYIVEGKQEVIPSQIIRVWLIAGSRWQRHLGEMTVRDIRLEAEGGDTVQVL